jgi:hypothetical protein
MENKKYEVAVRGFYVFAGIVMGMIIQGIINNQIIMKLLSMLIK